MSGGDNCDLPEGNLANTTCYVLEFNADQDHFDETAVSEFHLVISPQGLDSFFHGYITLLGWGMLLFLGYLQTMAFSPSIVNFNLLKFFFHIFLFYI